MRLYTQHNIGDKIDAPKYNTMRSVFQAQAPIGNIGGIRDDSNSILYQPEDDETISRQVYKAPAATFSVFCDATPVPVAHQENRRRFQDGFGVPVDDLEIGTPVYHDSDTPRAGFALVGIDADIDEYEGADENDNDSQESEGEYAEYDNPCDPNLLTTQNEIMARVSPPPGCPLYLHSNSHSELGKLLNSDQSKSAMEFEMRDIDTIYQVLDPVVRNSQTQTIYNIITSKNAKIDEGRSISMKITHKQTPPWEFYILSVLKARTDAQFHISIPTPLSCHVYTNETILLTSKVPPSISSVLAALKSQSLFGNSARNTGVDELLAMFWTAKLVSFIEKMHESGILHCNITPGNPSL